MSFCADFSQVYITYGADCNLRCKLCFVDFKKKPANASDDSLVDFIGRLHDHDARLEYVYWCGNGELFYDTGFTSLLNRVAERFPRLRHCLLTNGTHVEALAQVGCWDKIDEVRVSIDGLRDQHDWNRGRGTFDKSVRFVRTLVDVYGFTKISIKVLVRHQALKDLAAIPAFFRAIHPDIQFAINLPYDNAVLAEIGLSYGRTTPRLEPGAELVPAQDLIRFVRDAGLEQDYEALTPTECTGNYLALYGTAVYTCCDMIHPIGQVEDSVPDLHARLQQAVVSHCEGCLL